MNSMKLFTLTIFLSSLVATTLSLSHVQDVILDMQLNKINKPAVQSFETSYGEVFDCVDIHKQYAFDNPLLKDHSIQMKPQILNVEEELSEYTTSKRSPSEMQCPEGTVLVRRLQKRDLLQTKPSQSSLGINGFDMKLEYDVIQFVVSYIWPLNNTGVHGQVNVWQPEVVEKQFTTLVVFVGSQDGDVSNVIGLGWAVNSYNYPLAENYTKLLAVWTRDSEKTSGCIDMKCPAFVQTSRTVTLGMKIDKISTYGGDQYDVELSIQQDATTKNWWLYYGKEAIGYYPKEIFTTITNGATRGGWGGQVNTPPTVPAPGMGSGHSPQEGFKKAAYIKNMKLFNNGQEFIPKQSDLKELNEKPQCYQLAFTGSDATGGTMFVGGPPCKPQ